MCPAPPPSSQRVPAIRRVERLCPARPSRGAPHPWQALPHVPQRGAAPRTGTHASSRRPWHAGMRTPAHAADGYCSRHKGQGRRNVPLWMDEPKNPQPATAAFSFTDLHTVGAGETGPVTQTERGGRAARWLTDSYHKNQRQQLLSPAAGRAVRGSRTGTSGRL